MTSTFDPFTPSPEDGHYLREEYLSRKTRSPALRVFYRVKPAIPRSTQTAIRRQLAHRQAQRKFPAWPIEPVVIRNRARAMARELASLEADRLRVVNPWPAGHRFAVTLTHDVEGPLGIERIPSVLEVERRHGFVSSWNFVGEWYPITDADLQMVRDAGCEVGLHGLTHDGALFRDRRSFENSLPKVRHYLETWGAVGFRSPSTLRNAAWMHELPVLYDSSYPDTDPFQPQPGGCCWVYPFFFGEVVELPVTLDQDHTLFVLLRERSIDRWIQKSRWVIEQRGLVNVIVHPDYMDTASLARYEELLSFLAEQRDGWRALPRDVARWWKQRAEVSELLGRNGNSAHLEGPARMAWARLEGGQIVYAD